MLFLRGGGVLHHRVKFYAERSILGKKGKTDQPRRSITNGLFWLTVLVFLAGPAKLCAQTGIFLNPPPPDRGPFKEFGVLSQSQTHSLTPARPDRPEPVSFSRAFLQAGNRGRDRIFSDFSNFYEKETLARFGLACLGGSILANTKMDRNFQNWYQQDVHCNFTKELSEFTKFFGEGGIFIPVTVSTALIYRFHQEKSGQTGIERPIGNYFDRVARGYVVGTPTLLVGQILLGGNRPRDGSSYWQPFEGEDHGLSGHAFIGAIPFITAARMSKQIWVKGLFYGLSLLPAWSRVNDDAHFLSQSALGWYLAYLSVGAVSKTEGNKHLPKGMTLFPVLEGQFVGLGIVYRR